MVTISASVDIAASPKAVFDLVTDVSRRARLNPRVGVLGIAKITPGPVRLGTRFRYRVAVDGHIVEHACECVAFEPGRLMETVSDTKPPFRVRVTVEPIPGGARLTQEEFFELPPAVMPLPRWRCWPGRLLDKLFGGADCLRQSAESLAAEAEETCRRLQPRLAGWLERLKRHLEQGRGVFYA